MDMKYHIDQHLFSKAVNPEGYSALMFDDHAQATKTLLELLDQHGIAGDKILAQMQIRRQNHPMISLRDPEFDHIDVLLDHYHQLHRSDIVDVFKAQGVGGFLEHMKTHSYSPLQINYAMAQAVNEQQPVVVKILSKQMDWDGFATLPILKLSLNKHCSPLISKTLKAAAPSPMWEQANTEVENWLRSRSEAGFKVGRGWD